MDSKLKPCGRFSWTKFPDTIGRLQLALVRFLGLVLQAGSIGYLNPIWTQTHASPHFMASFSDDAWQGDVCNRMDRRFVEDVRLPHARSICMYVVQTCK